MQFFLKRSGSKELGNIFLIGGGASIEGLAEYLSQALGHEVHLLERLSHVQINHHETSISTLVNAAGALIRL